MASAQIIIQQGAVASAPGISLDTIVLGDTVTLSNSSAGNIGASSWKWELVGVPLGSTATISGSQSAVATFTPDLHGTYMVKLSVNGGVQPGETQIRLAAVRQVVGGLTMPTISVRIPGPGESNEANWDGNTQGWWPDFALLLGAAVTSYSTLDGRTGGGGVLLPGQDANSGELAFVNTPATDVVLESQAELGEIPPDTVWTFEATFVAAADVAGMASSSLIKLLGTAWRGSTGNAQIDYEILPKPDNMPGDSARLALSLTNPNVIELVWSAGVGGDVHLNWSRIRTSLATKI